MIYDASGKNQVLIYIYIALGIFSLVGITWVYHSYLRKQDVCVEMSFFYVNRSLHLFSESANSMHVSHIDSNVFQ